MIKLALATILLVSSLSTIAETSVCSGAWENGQPVHIVVDWDKGNVNVNGVVTKIVTGTSDGIYTSRHINKFGHRVSFGIINSTYNLYTKNGIFLYNSVNRATFVIQADIDDMQTSNLSHALHCSKSFSKPLMSRVI